MSVLLMTYDSSFTIVLYSNDHEHIIATTEISFNVNTGALNYYL